jgi:hypothetical protein
MSYPSTSYRYVIPRYNIRTHPSTHPPATLTCKDKKRDNGEREKGGGDGEELSKKLEIKLRVEPVLFIPVAAEALSCGAASCYKSWTGIK